MNVTAQYFNTGHLETNRWRRFPEIEIKAEHFWG